MNLADWRALIEAYLDGRISAEAFSRRFTDAWSAQRQGVVRPPRAVETLHAAVEAFEAASDGHEGETNDDEMREASRKALQQLREDVPVGGMAGPSGGAFRAGEGVRAFQFSSSGCAGVGCALAGLWVALCLLQWFAVSAQVQSLLEWSAAPATIVGLVLAFVPVVGNFLAFFGAVDVWDWSPWIAGLIFFAAPAATLISGWMRWQRTRR